MASGVVGGPQHSCRSCAKCQKPVRKHSRNLSTMTWQQTGWVAQWPGWSCILLCKQPLCVAGPWRDSLGTSSSPMLGVLLLMLLAMLCLLLIGASLLYVGLCCVVLHLVTGQRAPRSFGLPTPQGQLPGSFPSRTRVSLLSPAAQRPGCVLPPLAVSWTTLRAAGSVPCPSPSTSSWRRMAGWCSS